MTRTTTIVTDIVNKMSADNDSPSQATVRVQHAAKLIIFKQRVAMIRTSKTISLNVLCDLCLASFKRVQHRLYVAINQSYQTAAKIQTWLRESVVNLSLRLKNPYCYEHGQITNVNLTDRIIKWYNRGSLNPCYHWILKKINFYDVAEYVV